ncbi:agouti-signaling protein-like [Myripristis murdjan]|uniref:agouti-signaling protein-like n=1 Tax=Myripristis murdjan TaxID=586833 RepID=UPI00117622EA|nr:agouti-signaling protein-like [Myripristis murdjan]
MKLTVLCFCLLHVATVNAGLFTHSEITGANSNVSSNCSNDQAPQSTVSLIQVRQRTLFARRGKYERQKMHVMKPKVAPAPPRRPPPKVAPNPISPRCSRTGESCLPQSRCCEPCATCHCRFFNAICFCRKTNSQCGRKT